MTFHWLELVMLCLLKSYKKSMEAQTSTGKYGRIKSALTTSMITHVFKTFHLFLLKKKEALCNKWMESLVWDHSYLQSTLKTRSWLSIRARTLKVLLLWSIWRTREWSMRQLPPSVFLQKVKGLMSHLVKGTPHRFSEERNHLCPSSKSMKSGGLSMLKSSCMIMKCLDSKDQLTSLKQW